MLTETLLLVILGCLTTGGVTFYLWRHETPSFASRTLMLGMAAFAIDTLCTGFSTIPHTAAGMALWQRTGLMSRSTALLALALFSLSYARANFSEFLRRWRWFLIAFAVALIGLPIASWNDLFSDSSTLNPELKWTLDLGRTGSYLLTLHLILAAATLMNMERTLQAAAGTLRWKIKFITLGIGVILTAQIFTTTQMLIISAVTPFLAMTNQAATIVGCVLIYLSLQRTDLGKGDLYLSTHLIYRSLTILVIGGYLVVVGLTSKLLFDEETDRTYFSVKVLFLLMALALLGAMALSDRLRQRAKLLLSRHLLRPHYDHRQVWATLISRTSQSADATSFSRETTNWLAETFEFLSVSIWLIDEPVARLTLGGSTRTAITTPPTVQTVKCLTQGLRSCGDLADLNTTSAAWIDLIKQLTHDSFQAGGPQICLPLQAGKELVGMMLMTDRVQRISLTTEELDLIRTLATHIAARLYVYRLADQVMQGKQMEAFQAMSAFFVHDLKNTASTLSLMLQNLPRHFDDPAFREDALRAVSKSVNRINEMIAKLALFRQGMTILPTPSNLNDILTSTLSELPLPSGIEVHRIAPPLPAIPLDPDQIKKVCTNLVLNACDAMRDGGKLTLETSLQSPWILLSVSDTGAGMSPEFLHNSLFRPFKTTKPQGLGIGLFHAKVIIESHGGRIEVTSEPGKGSQFNIWLPVAGGTHETTVIDRG